MLLPTKGISYQRAIITVSSDVLEVLLTPASVSTTWERFNKLPSRLEGKGRISFDWFSLALSTLFMLDLVEWTIDGRLRRRRVSSND